MRKRPILALAALAAALWSPAAEAADEGCVRGFATYDRAVRAFSYSGWGENPPAAAIDRSVQRLRRDDCLTGWDEIATLQGLGEALSGSLQGEHGAPIPPTTLQAGIVTGISSEVQARQFFAGLGYRVRSQGAPYVGRRIYIGPFSTAGGLAEAVGVAERAGFVAPYARRF